MKLTGRRGGREKKRGIHHRGTEKKGGEEK
jgi:hypothetical protein